MWECIVRYLYMKCINSNMEISDSLFISDCINPSEMGRKESVGHGIDDGRKDENVDEDFPFAVEQILEMENNNIK